MSRRKLIPIIMIVLIFSCFKKSQGLKQSDVPGLVRQFLLLHVKYNKFDGEISKRTLSNFIYSLDYGKQYFYKSDIDKFKIYETKIDDYYKSGNFSFIYEIFATFKNRYEENIKLFYELLNSNIDFNKDELMVIDMDKINYANDKAEMKERWRKNIKLQLLNYMSADKSLADAKEKLIKRYKILEKRVKEIDQAKLLEKFMNAFTTALDPHSNYLSQDDHEDFMISMKLKFEGIGARLRTEDGYVIVDAIIPGGAADKLAAGKKLLPNDKIIEVSQSSDEPVDVIDMDLRDVVKLIRGTKGTEVRLTVLRSVTGKKSQERLVIPIIREEIALNDKDADSKLIIQKNQKKLIKIGYIKLPSFYIDSNSGKSSTGDLKKHIEYLVKQGAKGIILDLRGNPGGALRQAINIGGLFIDQGPILQVKASFGDPQTYNDEVAGEFYKGPLVILIDKFSASASEIVAGAMKDYQRAILIGPSSTFGKGTVQQYQPLRSKKGAIKITMQVFYQPNGTSNQGNGIKPDIKVPDSSLFWDIGEDKTRYPLKWEKIPKATFKKYNMVNRDILQRLKQRSAARVKNNKKFQELLKEIKTFRKQMNNKTISLKEESKIEKTKKKKFENNRKKMKRDELIDEDDIFLKEAFNVTEDYIQIISK